MAISLKTLLEMRQYTSGPSAPIHTAQKGAVMKSHGTSGPLKLHIEGFSHEFNIQPTVIEGLSGAVNIGTAFLTEISRGGKVSLTYTDGQPSLTIQGAQTEMIQTVTEIPIYTRAQIEPQAEVKSESCEVRRQVPAARQKVPVRQTEVPPPRPATAQGSQISPRAVLVAEDIVVTKNSCTYVPVKLQGRREALRTICVENSRVNGSEVIPGVYLTPDSSGHIAVLNTGQEDIYFSRNTRLTTYTELLPVSKQPPTTEGGVQAVRHNKMSPQEQEDILQDLKLEDKEVLKNPNRMKEAKALIREYIDVFSAPSHSIGTTDLIEFEVNIEPGAVPVSSKTRPLNPKQLEDLKGRIDEWIREGVVVPSDQASASWASPLVPVRKPDNSTRWCADFRALNRVTVPDRFPLPSITENLEKLQGNNYFSTLDSASAYHAIKVSEKSRPYLTIVSPLGLHNFCKMPFGARNAAACYSRFVQMALDGLDPLHILHYLDDVVVASPTWEQHLQHLRGCLEAHKRAGLKLRASKTKLFQKECQYLGFYVNKNGISMVSRYKEKVLDWPAPQSAKELASFLGFCNYYRNFIKDFSFLTNEMNSAKNKEKFEWTEEMNKKFLLLKEKFREAPIRAFPRYDSNEPFQLAVDFSKDNLGAVLTQVQDGKERLIGAHGRKTTPYERNYHSYKGEAAALMYGVRKFSHILHYKPFIVYTDNNAVTYLMSCKEPKGLLFRWIAELSSYQFTIKHRPGTKNVPADTISRSGHRLDSPTRDEVMEEQQHGVFDIHMVERLQEELNTLCLESEDLFDVDGELISFTDSELAENLDMSTAAMIKAQDEDPILSEVKQWLKDGKKPDKEQLKGAPELLLAYSQGFEHLLLAGDLLYDKRKLGAVSNKPLLRLVVPEAKWEAVFYWSHSHISAAHPGVRGTYMRAATNYYFPGISNYIKTHVAICERCLAKQTQPKRKDTVHRPMTKSFVGSRLCVDLVGPLVTPSPEGHKYILSMEDSFSRYVQLVPLKSKEGSVVAAAIYDGWFSKFGFVYSIHSDQGTEFTNSIMKELAKTFKIKLSTTIPYAPNQNGQVERFHRRLAAMMRTYLEREETNWTRYLPAACLAHNTAVHAATGLTPHYIMTGREAILPTNIVCPSPDLVDNSLNDHVKTTILNFARMYDFIRRNESKVIRRNAKLYNGLKDLFVPGTPVWYLSPTLTSSGKQRKLTNNWIGPYVVTEVLSTSVVSIKPLKMEGRTLNVSVNRLVPCRNTAVQRGQNLDQDPEPLDEEDDGEILPPADLRPPLPVIYPDAPPEMRDLTRRGRGRPPTRRPQEQDGPVPPRHDPPAEVQPRFRSPSPPLPSPGRNDVEMREEREERGEGSDPGPPSPMSETAASPAISSPTPRTPRIPPSSSEGGDRGPGHGGARQPRPQDHGGVVQPRDLGAVPRQPRGPQPGGEQPRPATRRTKAVTESGNLKVKFAPDDISSQIHDTGIYRAKQLQQDLQYRIQGKEKRVLQRRKPPEESKRKRSPDARRSLKARLRQRADKYLDISSSDSSEPEESVDTDTDINTVKTLHVKITKGSLMPERATEGAACWDLRAARNTDLPPGKITRVPLKLQLQIPRGYFMLLLSRSGLSLKGITTEAGVIDSDFRSEIHCLLLNSNTTVFRVNKGCRVTQGLLLPCQHAEWHQVAELDPVASPHLGFGSTGDQ